MPSQDKYTIDYQSLSLGEHHLVINIDQSLFNNIPQNEINSVNATANIILLKHHNFAELNVNISGAVNTPCDRCLDPVEIPVKWQSNCIIKVTDNQPDNDDPDIIYISPNESAVSIKQYIYESIILSLPVQRVHQNINNCNQNIIQFISNDQ